MLVFVFIHVWAVLMNCSVVLFKIGNKAVFMNVFMDRHCFVLLLMEVYNFLTSHNIQTEHTPKMILHSGGRDTQTPQVSEFAQESRK